MYSSWGCFILTAVWKYSDVICHRMVRTESYEKLDWDFVTYGVGWFWGGSLYTPQINFSWGEFLVVWRQRNLVYIVCLLFISAVLVPKDCGKSKLQWYWRYLHADRISCSPNDDAPWKVPTCTLCGESFENRPIHAWFVCVCSRTCACSGGTTWTALMLAVWKLLW